MLDVRDVPMVTLLTARLMRWPAVPLNVTVAFSLATVVVTVTGGPPGTMVYDDACAGGRAARKALAASRINAPRPNQRIHFSRNDYLPDARAGTAHGNRVPACDQGSHGAPPRGTPLLSRSSDPSSGPGGRLYS